MRLPTNSTSKGSDARRQCSGDRGLVRLPHRPTIGRRPAAVLPGGPSRRLRRFRRATRKRCAPTSMPACRHAPHLHSPATRAPRATTTAMRGCTTSTAMASPPRSSFTAARTKSRSHSARSSSSSTRRPPTESLIALGRHIYNQWLADFCALAPARRVGLAQLPLWDIDAAVAEVEWAHDARSARHQLPRARARVCRCTTTARGSGSGRCAPSGA